MDHFQPPSPIKTDNTTSFGYVHNNIQLKRSKYWDMRHHWLQDKETHKIMRVFWELGDTSDAYYFTKHYPTTYSRLMRPNYGQNKIIHVFNMMSFAL